MNEQLPDLQDLAAAVVADELGAAVMAVEPILDKGIVNRVFRVRTHDGSVIARMNQADSLSQFRKEAWCIGQAEAVGVPTSSVRAVGERDGAAYFVVADLGTNDATDTTDQERLWRALGEHARLIHQIKTRGIGDAMLAPGVFAGSWSRYLEDNLQELAERPQLGAILAGEEAGPLHHAARMLRGKPLRFGLNHGDLSLKNAIVVDTTVALFDWGSSEAHVVPHFDLIEALKSSFNLDPERPAFQALLAGYGIERSEHTDLLPELKALLVIRAVDKLRWALDRSPERVEHYTRNLRKIAAYVLNT